MRTHFCGEISQKQENDVIVLCGWVHRRRDHGGVIFIDLRDVSGIAQVVIDSDEHSEIFALGERLRHEYVLRVEGKVRLRPEGTENPDMQTGAIEVIVNTLEILNASSVLPFQLDEHSSVGEDTRLRYRYLDLRRPEMLNHLRFRSKVTHHIRNFLENNRFIDVETPILTRATPEGARDYLVPSRTHAGHFFALPQSPQLFKQILMVSGVDRYYQIAKCFRDEDLRADRQPEFTQVDLEASFVDEKAVMQIAEELIQSLFADILSVNLPTFPCITYAEAMQRFGSDKPDLRIPLELVELTDLMQDVEFKVFREAAQTGRVAALKLPGGTELSRKAIDDYTKFVSIYGAKGLAYIKVNDLAAGFSGLQSPILKFFPEQVIQLILERVAARTGDIIFFGADSVKVVSEALGALRVKLGHDLKLFDQNAWAPCWVVDFPMFEQNEKGGLQALHHPFTAPSCSIDALQKSPQEALSRAYDMVLNGVELGGGSMRIHDAAMQQAVFKLLGISTNQAEKEFGFLLKALQYGCPPHGGLAFGLDRLMMLMLKTTSIRDVIAFPKTQSAACMMTEAPGEVENEALKELHIKRRQPIGAS